MNKSISRMMTMTIVVPWMIVMMITAVERTNAFHLPVYSNNNNNKNHPMIRSSLSANHHHHDCYKQEVEIQKPLSFYKSNHPKQIHNKLFGKKVEWPDNNNNDNDASSSSNGKTSRNKTPAIITSTTDVSTHTNNNNSGSGRPSLLPSSGEGVLYYSAFLFGIPKNIGLFVLSTMVVIKIRSRFNAPIQPLFSGDRCPWPFIFFHDVKIGFQDYQTWIIVLWIALRRICKYLFATVAIV